MKSDQVFVLLHASVLKLGSEMTFISALSWFKKNKKHCASYYFTQCKLSVRKDARAELIAVLLERQTHGISGCTKRSCFKNTQALPFSLKWLQPHYSTWRSLWVFIHYTTLSANPSFVFFSRVFFSCLVINTYDTTHSATRGQFVAWWWPAEKRRSIHPQSASVTHAHLSLQVLASARWLAKANCSKVNVLLRLDAAEREESRSTREFVRGSGFNRKLAWLESIVNMSLSRAGWLLQL